MRKLFFKQYFKVFSIGYWSIYLLTAFVKWEFYNPFWWLVQLPYFTPENRMLVLVSAFFISIFNFMLVQIFILTKNR